MKGKYEFDCSDKYNMVTTIHTPIGKFVGVARVDKDSGIEPKIIVGEEISAARAEIKMYKAMIKDKKSQLKGLSRAGIPIRSRIYQQIKREITELQTNIDEANDEIKYWIEEYDKYLQSKKLTKEDREQIKENITQMFKQLSQVGTQFENKDE